MKFFPNSANFGLQSFWRPKGKSSNTLIVDFDRGSAKQLMDQLNKLPEELRVSVARRGIRKGLSVMEAHIRARVPVETGKLASSIKKTTIVRPWVVTGIIKVKAPHAHLMEFGYWLTKGKHIQRRVKFIQSNPPGGYMRSALTTYARDAVEAYEKTVRDALARVAKNGYVKKSRAAK
jgi:hypothetical protein